MRERIRRKSTSITFRESCEWVPCSRFKQIYEFVLHDGADGVVDAEGVCAADNFEQAAGGEFFD